MTAAFGDDHALVDVIAGDGVVDHGDLVLGDAVLRHDFLLGVVAHGYDAVGGLHACLFDVGHGLVEVVAAAVMLQGRDMGHQRFARQLLDQHPRRIGHPVMDMDDVEFQASGDDGRCAGITVDLAHEVFTVTAVQRQGLALFPGLCDLAQKVLPLRAFMLQDGPQGRVGQTFFGKQTLELPVLFQIAAAVQIGAQRRVDIFQMQLFAPDLFDLVPEAGDELRVLAVMPYLAHVFFAPEAGAAGADPGARGGKHGQAVLQMDGAVTFGTGQDKEDLRAFLGQCRGHALAGRAQPAALEGGKFPAEHEDAHYLSPCSRAFSHCA